MAHWRDMRDAFHCADERRPFPLRHACRRGHGPTKPDSIPEPLNQIENAIVRKPDAMLFTAVDYKALVPGIDNIATFIG